MKAQLIRQYQEVYEELKRNQLIQKELIRQKDEILNEILGRDTIFSNLSTRARHFLLCLGIDTDAKLIRFLDGDTTAIEHDWDIRYVDYCKCSTPYERLLTVRSISHKTAKHVLDVVATIMTTEKKNALCSVDSKLESVNSSINVLSNEKSKLECELHEYDTKILYSLPSQVCQTLYFIGIKKDSLLVCFLNGSICFNEKTWRIDSNAFRQANTPYERLLSLYGVGPATANKCLQIVKSSEYASFIVQ